ncbi:hypothetical protein LCGC14_0576970 [marine sediment metagenome]|uniref:Uncharacterized protein n=1 Tax=marine sediment metagenome TaxID=412755 RepID=A0A0F9RHI9_9ZZZZ
MMLSLYEKIIISVLFISMSFFFLFGLITSSFILSLIWFSVLLCLGLIHFGLIADDMIIKRCGT